MIKGIILNTEQEAIDLVTDINIKFSFLFKGITISYTYYIKHPIELKFAVLFREKDVSNMVASFPEIIDSMSFLPSDIVDLPNWFE